MKTEILKDKEGLAQAAASHGAKEIKAAIAARGTANVILATGASQFDMLKHLIATPGIDWTKVTMFHLDEYIDLPITHPASFRKYLQERFVDKVGKLKAINFVAGDTGNPEQECKRLGELISKHPIDVAFVGIGENGHLAFNDPPADFDTEEAYLVVNLDELCRKQQFGEGWFHSMNDVPTRAISMGIRQIMRSACIICSVPDKRKAVAVEKCVDHPVTNMNPASIMQNHKDCTLYLETESASLLRN